jgi:prophage DNA circulation protein
MRETSIDGAATAIVVLINAAPKAPNASAIADVLTNAASTAEVLVASPLMLKVRLCRQTLHAAITEALEVEGTVAHEAACSKVRRRTRELDDLADRVWQRPIDSWDDVVMRAEVALAYHQSAAGRNIEGLDAACPFERSLAELLSAVADIGGCWPASDAHQT